MQNTKKTVHVCPINQYVHYNDNPSIGGVNDQLNTHTIHNTHAIDTQIRLYVMSSTLLQEVMIKGNVSAYKRERSKGIKKPLHFGEFINSLSRVYALYKPLKIQQPFLY